MSEQNLTDAQRLAVLGNFKNVLVSASAGSGKTFVMINRVINLIINGKAHLNEIMCVTFTDFAAREMKQKLSDAINERIKTAKGENYRRLIEELDNLQTAQISTIHSFCSGVLKEFFYEAGITAGFKVLDGDESKSIANRAIDRLFERLYESENPDLQLVLPYYFNKRNDAFLRESIIEIYTALISEVNPLDILDKGKKYYTKEGLYEIYDFFKKEYLVRIKELKEELNSVIYCITNFEKLYDFAQEISDLLDRVESAENIFEMKNVMAAKKLVKPAVKKNSTQDEIDESKIFEKFYKGSFDSFKKEIAKIEICGEETDLKTLTDALPVYEALCNLVKAFFDAYRAEKDDENAVDFNDLEQLTYRLLSQNADVRAEIQERFKYIFIDEYQDTSGVQEAILELVSDKNRFMVGDLKQSIYNFRGGSPDIFKGKYFNSTEIDPTDEEVTKTFFKGDNLPDDYENCVINLDKNFRSTSAVLTSVNNLFSAVMFESFGGVNYRKNPMEVGADYPKDEGIAKMYAVEKPEAEVTDLGGVYSVIKHLEQLKDQVFSEGEAVAQIISEVKGKKFYNIKTKREEEIKYSDITILLRNANSKADLYVKELIRRGISVSASTKNSIGEYAEVALAVNVLQLINGMNQDIPLVAVLKSVIGGFTESELMQIRKQHSSGSFYEAYRACLADGSGELVEKIKKFDEYVKQLRVLADFMPCDELLTKIVRDNSWDVELLSTVSGEAKLARLNRFIKASGAKKQTASEFLQNIEQTLQSLTMDYSDENSVKIMSIHASKGLEFPVVILAGTSNPYSKDDYKGDFITHKKYGFAIYSKNLQTMVKRETAFRTFLRYKNKKALREEELRLLYVAMTRAKNQLYITGEFTKKEKVDMPVKETHGLNDGQTVGNYFSIFACTDLPVEKWEKERNSVFAEQKTKQVLIGNADEALKQKIASNLAFEYAFKQDLYLPLKRSVTSAAHFDEDESAPYEYSAIYGDSSAEKGTAYHRFLEVCDFNASSVENEFNRLIASRLLTEEQQKLIEIKQLEKILDVPIFKQLKNYKLYREQQFTCLIPAKTITEDYSGSEEILLQGIIDLLAVNDDGAVIIDYKFTTLKNDEDVIRRYKTQLSLYKYAVEKVLKISVKKALIVNIYSAKVIEIPV